MTRYRFQICLDYGTAKARWRDAHPAGRPESPYTYDTRVEAEERLCYSIEPYVRVIEIEGE